MYKRGAKTSETEAFEQACGEAHAAARPRPEARSRCGAAGADTATEFSFLMGSNQLGRRSGSKILRLRLWSSWFSSGLLNDVLPEFADRFQVDTCDNGGLEPVQ